MGQWRLFRSGSLERDLISLSVIDAFNRFAREAQAEILDPDGTKEINYSKGTSVTLKVRPPDESDYFSRFGGFVIDSNRKEDTTILDILSHDFWLRRRQIFETYSSAKISTILEDLITKYTPLSWNSDNIDIYDDSTLTRTWKGERLDEVIEELANASANEEFGANNDIEFFFRQQSIMDAPLDFDKFNTLDMEFKNNNKESINKVNLYYGEKPDRGLVTLQDREDQKELQDEIGAERPVVREASYEYPQITTEEQAKRKAKAILDGKTGKPIEGNLKIVDGDRIYPGQVTNIKSEEHNIGEDFRIAEIEYNYPSTETNIKVAENRVGVEEVLSNFSKDITRIDMKNVDADATPTQIVGINNEVGIKTTITAYKYLKDYTKFGLGDKNKYGNGVGDSALADAGSLGDSRTGKDLIFRRES